jgi:hypothetical protein
MGLAPKSCSKLEFIQKCWGGGRFLTQRLLLAIDQLIYTGRVGSFVSGRRRPYLCPLQGPSGLIFGESILSLLQVILLSDNISNARV